MPPGKDVLLPLRLFRNKIANLGLGTQTIQWLILQGSFFAVSVYLQEVNHYSPIQTGLMLTPATIGILAASAGAGRFARRHPQRWLTRTYAFYSPLNQLWPAVTRVKDLESVFSKILSSA